MRTQIYIPDEATDIKRFAQAVGDLKPSKKPVEKIREFKVRKGVLVTIPAK